MKLLLVLSALLIAEGSSLLVDENTPVHLLKSTYSGLIKDTRTGLFDKSKLSNFWERYQILGVDQNSLEPDEPSRSCNVGKMLRKIRSEPLSEEIGLGIWDTLGELFGYGYGRPPVKSHVPTPDVVYPEILVIIDYELYASFRTLNELISRLYVFWEGVDKLYEPIHDPKLKLSIAGVLIPTDPDVFKFMKPGVRSIFNWASGLDYEEVKQGMESWLYEFKETFSEDSYDVFIIITPFRENSLFSSTVGLASVGGACNIDEYFQTLTRGGIIFETENFEDTLTAAHELGHLFGLHHDEEAGCGNGYIMAATNKKYNTKWSICSQEGLRQYFANYEPTCLYNKPESLIE